MSQQTPVKVHRPKEWRPELAAAVNSGANGGNATVAMSREEKMRRELGLNDADVENGDEDVANWGFGDDPNGMSKEGLVRRVQVTSNELQLAIQEITELRAQLNDVCERHALADQKNEETRANLKQVANSRVLIVQKSLNEKIAAKEQEVEDEKMIADAELKKADVLRGRIVQLETAISAGGGAIPPPAPHDVAAMDREVERRLNRKIERLQAETINLRQQLEKRDTQIYALEEDNGKLKETASNLIEANQRLTAAKRGGMNGAMSPPVAAPPPQQQQQQQQQNIVTVVDDRVVKELQQKLAFAQQELQKRDEKIQQLANQVAEGAAGAGAPTPAPAPVIMEDGAKIKAAQAKCAQLEGEIATLQKALADREKAVETTKAKAIEIQKKAAERVAAMEAELEASKTKKGMSEATERAIIAQVAKQRQELAALRASYLELRTKALEAQRDIFPAIKQFYGPLRKKLEGFTASVMEKYKAEMKERKRLFNLVQELKGNIRVYCRVRPLLPHEIADGQVSIASFGEENEVAFWDDTKMTDKTFEFERVFSPESRQEEVFNELEGLITSVLDGYNVCIFAYGQTGSGKTHTMEGDIEDPGVNPRALDRLFHLIRERSSEVAYRVTVSIIEIYMEEIHDLLQNNYGKKLEIRQGPTGNFVQDCTVVDVACVEDVREHWMRGSQNRRSASNNINVHSSRSHLILQLIVEAHNSVTGVRTLSKLNLIDLAGSERVARTQAAGDRLDEAKAINKSLSALGGVIQSLGQKQAHVRFRDTKLTHLLQDSLNGDAKTLMIVQVSPAKIDLPESLCSLDFASRARSVELGQARKNVTAAAKPKTTPR